MALTYSNPRMQAEIPNWPLGGSTRGTARFTIEVHPKRGQRAIRGIRPDGKASFSSPKLITFSKLARIVDGSDGRTYIARLTEFGHISIFQGNMQFEEESLFPDNPRYSEVRALFETAQ